MRAKLKLFFEVTFYENNQQVSKPYGFTSLAQAEAFMYQNLKETAVISEVTRSTPYTHEDWN